ncbi:hypothetical protein ACFVUW_10420 [Streptomyces xiamenensis]|uniref:hypothetical protein n=1 Tax=Streptomyces xiamenensis TaxID=408015 RepID=UPI0036EDAD4E
MSSNQHVYNHIGDGATVTGRVIQSGSTVIFGHGAASDEAKSAASGPVPGDEHSNNVLREVLDAPGPRLPLLTEGEAVAVARLLDIAAGALPHLGTQAQELADRIYDRLAA